jgi:hypothetical protein
MEPNTANILTDIQSLSYPILQRPIREFNAELFDKNVQNSSNKWLKSIQNATSNEANLRFHNFIEEKKRSKCLICQL